MIDFLMVANRSAKKGLVEIYPKFIIKKSNDLMIRGGDFYAIWVEERGMWSTDEQDVIRMVDQELDRYARENGDKFDAAIRVLHMWDAESGMIDAWHKYCQKQMRDNFHMLDEKLIFSNTAAGKKDYASKALPYPLEKGKTDAYDRLMSVLYSPEERRKIEWAIGAIVHGDSKDLQKFLVLYGPPKSGKSTVIKIIEKLFEGYISVFDARALGSSSNSFALESFKTNPLVAIQHDGDLSHIEDNTRLNSLVSHELMTVNEKFKSAYATRFKSFLIMATNKPVKITDSKSGIIRRLIDVTPTGEKIPEREYLRLTRQVDFELGAIAYHCQQVYLEDPDIYNNYVPLTMMGATNDFYNFMLDSYLIFSNQDGTTMKAAWEMYKTWCDEAKVTYPYSQRIFKEELRSYFKEYDERPLLEDGSRPRSWYSGFRRERFEQQDPRGATSKNRPPSQWLTFTKRKSPFDEAYADCLAQYESEEEGRPEKKWANVTTKLKDIDTSKVHYVLVPGSLVTIDFDIPDENGKKCFAKNVEAAGKWPPTYAELSKSGEGIHLEYIYTGDSAKLDNVFAEHIEIKVQSPNSTVNGFPLRRRLSKNNGMAISTISSGLPLKGEKMVNFDTVKSENGLRMLIKRNLNKEIHPGTKPSIDFIYKILEDAYAGGLNYDVSDMRQSVLIFAANSTHQSDYCLKMVAKMHFKSEDASAPAEATGDIVFYDVEVFPNLFLVNWKFAGEGKSVVRMINPAPADIEELLKFKLVGFNCRRYDNHMLYARLIGSDNIQLYNLSQQIINEGKGFFGEAYNISYTDVYDYASTKQSLKKWEIQLGIHHQELGLPWDQPVPEEMWPMVAEYCDNDVIATEAVFHATHADFVAREILADVAGMTLNDTTNSLTTRIIFGGNRRPQDQFNYRDMGDESRIALKEEPIDDVGFDEYTVFDNSGHPIFPGYIYDRGKSYYRKPKSKEVELLLDSHGRPLEGVRFDEVFAEVGEGGYVYSEPGIYHNIALLDIASMHPSSIIAEDLFGKEHTARFKEILDARIAIKHKDFDKARTLLGGKLEKYLTDKDSAKALSQALKIAINSVYGLTSAKFDNPFRDIRNKDNIVAKRGALFMINLEYEVKKRGFTVAHIKTDSIKIPNATPEIIRFVMDYGKLYGYNFEHEATYEKMCLVNDAVYIAQYATKEDCENRYGYCPGDNADHPGVWTATGTQFQIPYVFKTLFSKEEVIFDDLCETKSVSKGAIYLDRNEGLPEGEQKLQFIGRVGLFCPMKPGCDSGILLRVNEEKQYAVTGTKGYRWMEAEEVKKRGLEDWIDKSYYERLCNEAVLDIGRKGSGKPENEVTDDEARQIFAEFVSDHPSEEDLPF